MERAQSSPYCYAATLLAALQGASCGAQEQATAPVGDAAPSGGDDTEPLPRECGVAEATDAYIGPCDMPYGDGQRSTLCDEERGRCFVPTAECDAGWCRIPAASYVSGIAFEADVAEAYVRDPASIRLVPRDFEIMNTEVTHAQFAKVMGYIPDNAPPCLDCPVGAVSIFSAMEYANRLSIADDLDLCYELVDCGFEPVGPYRGWFCLRAIFLGPECTGYRLPSRAEWELASRAGSPWCYAFGKPCCGGCAEDAPFAEVSHACGSNTIDYRHCNEEFSYYDETGAFVCIGPSPVATLRPNPFGLYDTNGNVAELTQTVIDPALACGHLWCSADVPIYADPLAVDLRPEFLEFQIARDTIVYRVGGWYAQHAEYTCSNGYEAAGLNESIFVSQSQGFRLVRTIRLL